MFKGLGSNLKVWYQKCVIDNERIRFNFSVFFFFPFFSWFFKWLFYLFFSVFLHLWRIQVPFLLLEQWSVVLHHLAIFFNFSSFSSLSFTTITFFLGAFFFGLGTSLGIFYKFISLSICENKCFNLPFSTPPYYSPSFCALGKAKSAFLWATT